ncbi:MAG: single-stranded DNA-binding protein [Pseudomonadota bacterium]
MQGINSVILMGRIGRDPDLRQTPQGKAVCRFSMATPHSRREGDGWVEEAEWHDIVLWEAQAERFHRLANKGDLCTVEGRLCPRTWTDAEGKRHWKVEVVGHRANLVYTGRKPASQESPQPDPAQVARSSVAMPEHVDYAPESTPPF